QMTGNCFAGHKRHSERGAEAVVVGIEVVIFLFILILAASGAAVITAVVSTVIVRAISRRSWRRGRARRHGDSAEATEYGRALLRDHENILLRIDHEFHVEGRSSAAGGRCAEAPAEMLAFTERAHTVRGDRLTEN